MLANRGWSHMKKQRKHRVLRIVLVVLIALVCALALGIHVYASDYYHALPQASNAETSTESVEVQKLDNGDVTFVPADSSASAALVFYPGGKVEADAYAPLLARLAQQDVACVLVRMPENLAVLAPNRADRGRAELEQALSEQGSNGSADDPQGAGSDDDQAGNLDNAQTDAQTGSSDSTHGASSNNVQSDGIPWIMTGHSLGGAMAASYVASHTTDYQGLVLLAAYSTADLTQSGVKVLSVYGSNDGVLNRATYAEDRANLPQDTTECVIDGGIHSYFGTYGHQDGDGEAAITNDEQLDLTADAIAVFAKDL